MRKKILNLLKNLSTGIGVVVSFILAVVGVAYVISFALSISFMDGLMSMLAITLAFLVLILIVGIGIITREDF